jgi:hypothetical protein
MSSSDREFFGMLAGALLAVAAIVVALILASNRPEPAIRDLTESYAMPPHLAGCKVFLLLPKGHGRGLYVVTDGERPVATSWDNVHQKHTERVTVETP